MTSKSDSIGVTCTRLWHFADTFSQWNSCWKKLTLGHVTENKCGYQMHIFVTSFSAQHAHAWRCFCMVQPLRQPFRPKCTNRILQMHHQNPVVPPESGAHQQNPVCTYSVNRQLNYAKPVYGVATICHQVRCLGWGHPVSLFHTATSLLFWYEMFCMRHISYRLIWMTFFRVCAIWDAQAL